MRLTYDAKIELRGYPEFDTPEDVERLRSAIQETASRLYPTMVAVTTDVREMLEFDEEERPDPDWMPKGRSA